MPTWCAAVCSTALPHILTVGSQSPASHPEPSLQHRSAEDALEHLMAAWEESDKKISQLSSELQETCTTLAEAQGQAGGHCPLFSVARCHCALLILYLQRRSSTKWLSSRRMWPNSKPQHPNLLKWFVTLYALLDLSLTVP